MITSLVTGGAGFVGSHVAKHLLGMGHKVVVLDDLSGGTKENIPAGADFHHVDIRHAVQPYFDHYKPDYVFHLAAYAAEGLSHFIRRYNYEVNVIGSVNLINAAVNVGTVKRFVFTSSAAVYGNKAHGAYEFDAHYPTDPYGVAKRAVEDDLICASEMFGLPYTIFRCHNVYGPQQNLNDGYRNVIAIFMRQRLQGKPMTVFGSGDQSRCFTYIDDVAPYIAGCIDVAKAEYGIFNVGAEKNITIKELVWAVHRCHDAPGDVQIEYLPARKEASLVSLNHSAFDRAFGLHKDTMLGTGLGKMIEWARTQTLRDPQPFTEIEIDKNLPESWRKLHEH